MFSNNLINLSEGMKTGRAGSFFVPNWLLCEVSVPCLDSVDVGCLLLILILGSQSIMVDGFIVRKLVTGVE
jgi:hypothetical protein